MTVETLLISFNRRTLSTNNRASTRLAESTGRTVKYASVVPIVTAASNDTFFAIVTPAPPPLTHFRRFDSIENAPLNTVHGLPSAPSARLKLSRNKNPASRIDRSRLTLRLHPAELVCARRRIEPQFVHVIHPPDGDLPRCQFVAVQRGHIIQTVIPHVYLAPVRSHCLHECAAFQRHVGTLHRRPCRRHGDLSRQLLDLVQGWYACHVLK